MSVPEKVSETIYWVGVRSVYGTIDCNPYLIIEDGEGVLVDPGSTLEYADIRKSVTDLIALDKISLAVVNHPDPDIASGLPQFREAGLAAPIAMHWRTSTLLPFYGIKPPFYLVNEKGWEWSFHTGRRLRFIPSPYCHFPGSIMTYDERTGTLFSGDLFGSLSRSSNIFAGDDYEPGMKSFHEHYMPSHAVLAPVMESILPLNIVTVAPQHGQVITHHVREYILKLKDLECGTYLGNTEALLGSREAIAANAETRLPGNADRAVPDMTAAAIQETGHRPPDGDRLLHDANTGLHNRAVYRQYLSTLLERANGYPFSILYFSVDNLEEINQLRGRKAGDDAIRSLAYLIKNNTAEISCRLFKLDMPYIAAIVESGSKDSVRAMAAKVRQDSVNSDFTTDRLTVSAGILHSDQMPAARQERDGERTDRLILARLFRARKTPSGSICDYLQEVDTELYLKKKILLVEPDQTYVGFLEPFFAERGYLLMTAPDGRGLSKFRDEDTPDLVIAEAMTPIVNGFELREKMLASSKGKNTPFILISRRKDEEFIRRAAEAGIVHFLKKPFSKTELLGLVDNLLGHQR